MRHCSLENRCAALIVGQEVHVGIQSGMNHIDVLGLDARGYDKSVLPGHQIHERSTGPDHAAGRIIRRSVTTPSSGALTAVRDS